MLASPVALLNDHAHLEKKAASNALDMLSRWPTTPPPENWVKSMVAIAKDEVDHLYLVIKYLESFGGNFSKHHKNGYATALHAYVRLGAGPLEHVDRLLVSAMIELRSCERFKVLGEGAEHLAIPELQKLYQGLWLSERGHFTVFLTMAKALHPEYDVLKRWEALLDFEPSCLASQSAELIAIHSADTF